MNIVSLVKNVSTPGSRCLAPVFFGKGAKREQGTSTYKDRVRRNYAFSIVRLVQNKNRSSTANFEHRHSGQ